MKAVVVMLMLLLIGIVAAYQGVQPLASVKDKVVNWVETKTSDASSPTQTPTKPIPKGIVSKWRNQTDQDQYMEFFKDGTLVTSDGKYIYSGTYKLVSSEYVQISLEGWAGFAAAFSGAETFKYKIFGDTLFIIAGGRDVVYIRVR